MSKKTNKTPAALNVSESESITPRTNELEIAEINKSLVKKENRLADLEQRLTRIEKRTKNNERFSRTFANCLATQVSANEAVADVLRRVLHDDAAVQEELMLAIREYDQHKCRRFLSGFLGVLVRMVALGVAAFVGAFIYWVFSGV